ncbi:hypothetical protein EAF56_20290 [Vibrio alginolyticus]|nr:hypothetical protein [Vibrio alginolyticus]
MGNKMNKENNKSIDAERINDLLADKERADRDVHAEMRQYALYEGKVSGVMDSEYADSRIVAVVYEGDTTDKLLGKIEQQAKINEQLVEEAPMYFKDASQSFRTPTIIRNVTKLKVTVNSAVSSQKRTGEQLVARYARAIKRLERELKTLKRKEKIEKNQELIETLKAEMATFAKKPEKLYRLRTKAHDDVIALYSVAGGPVAMEKVRVNVGGLVAVKDKNASLQHFSVKPVKRDNSSVYAELEPIPNSLGLKGLLFDEDEAEKLRELRQQEKSQNEEKIRPKGDDLVN